MAIQIDSFGERYDDTEYELDMYGSAVPIGDGVSSMPSTTSSGALDYFGGGYTGDGFSGVGDSPPPAGATTVSPDGKSWLDKYGNILAPIIAGVVSPALSNLQSGGLLGKSTDMVTNAGNAFNGIVAPDLTRLIPQLQLQVMQGYMTPAQAAAAVQEASGMQDVNTDAQSLQGQRDALARLAEIGTSGGMTEADRAALAATMNQTSAKTASDRAAQIQQMQMQGNAGAGSELAARLSGVQGGANANAMAGASSAQAAQARALAAIQAGLEGNANLNTQQFDQAAKKAAAQDAVNAFNAQARQNTNLANAGWQQSSNLNNFNTANEIAGKNTVIQNTQAMLPYESAQKNFTNQAALAKDKANAQLYGGKVLGDMAQKQISASGALSGTAPAATGGNTNSSGQTVDPITGAITKAVGGVIGDGLGGLISDGLGAIGSWFGFKDGGYVEPVNSSEMSDQDIDHMIAKMTDFKYRRKQGQ